MKIATFNLFNFFEKQYYTYGVKVDPTPQMVAAMVENRNKVIQTAAPDILFAEEIGSKELFEKLVINENSRHFLASPDHRGIGNGVIYSSAKSIETVKDFDGFPVLIAENPDTLGPQFESHREFIYLQTDYAGKLLHIIGVHLKALTRVPLKNPSGESIPAKTQSEAGDSIIRMFIYKLAQARRVRQLVDGIFSNDPKAQIIVLGDFNEQHDSEILNIIKGDLDDDTKLKNFCETLPEGKNFSCQNHGKKFLVDHVLVSKSLTEKVAGINIYNGDLADGANIDNSRSDHGLVCLTLARAQ